MARTKGALNKSTIAKRSDIVKNDGYAEAFTGLGTNRDRSSFTRAKSANLLQQQELSDLYISDGYARKIVDIVAEECTRAGIELDGFEDESLKNNVQSKLQSLNAMTHMNSALRWGRLYGGSVVIYGLNDGGTLDTPLNIDGIKNVEFVRIYDRFQATIQTRYRDPLNENYGKPEYYLISPVDGGQPYTVHESRCHVLDGEPVPDLIRQLNQGWGGSVLQSCIDQLTRLGTSYQWANAILERSQQAVHKIPNLADTLRSPGGEALVQKRVDVVDMVRGILNTIVVDGMEDYNVMSLAMTGVNELLDRNAEALAGVANIPMILLTGRASGGLNSNDKSGMDGWYGRIESIQNDKIREPLDKLITYIIIAETGSDMEYELKFNSLKVISEKEKAEVEKLEAEHEKIEMETASGYVAIGALDVDEVRKEISDDYDLGLTNLDSVDLAIAELERVKKVVQTNMPINIANGEIQQAQLEKEVAESVYEALQVLENYLKGNLNDTK